MGHATRSLVVINALIREGADVTVFSGGEAAEFLAEEGLKVADIVDDSPPRVSKGRMVRASIWYLRSWRGHRKTLPRTRKLFDSSHPELVVCDEEFSGIVVAHERGIKRAFISDELELGFARDWFAGLIERRIERWYRNLQGSVEALIIPEEGVDRGNTRYVGPIVRGVSAPGLEARRRHGLPAAGPLVLLSLSGSGLGDFLIAPTLRAVMELEDPRAFLVVTGNRGRKVEARQVYDLGVVKDNQDLVASADLVVSSAGKSTIDEAAASGTPIIAIPIANHAEQERNAAALGYSFEDVKRLDFLVKKKIGVRDEPVPSPGAERATRLILSMLD